MCVLDVFYSPVLIKKKKKINKQKDKKNKVISLKGFNIN